MLLQKVRDGEVLQGEAGHVEDGDVVGLADESGLAGDEVSERGAWRFRRPLRFAHLARLRRVIDEEARARQQPGG